MSEESARVVALDAAFRSGDLDAVQRLSLEPELFPNGAMPLAIGSCLEYAIYHSPVPMVRRLLEMGADTRPDNHHGFPPLHAAMASASSSRVQALVELLLEHGADPNQHGFNDYTALHVAVADERIAVVKVLLRAGGDPHRRTRIDDLESSIDLARRSGNAEILELLGEERAV